MVPESRSTFLLRRRARFERALPSSSAFDAAAAGCPDAAGDVAVFAPEKAAVLAVVVVSADRDVEAVAVAVCRGVEAGLEAEGLDEAVGSVPGEGPG